MKIMPPRICLVAFFTHEAFFTPLSNIRKIIHEIGSLSESITIVDPKLVGKIVFDNKKDDVIIYKKNTSFFLRILSYFCLNLQVSWKIFLKSKHADSFIFFMESGMPLPMITAKICNRRIFWFLPSSFRKMVEHKKDNVNLLLIPLESILYFITDKIVLYSHNLEKAWNLQKYSAKILIAHEHFIDTSTFTELAPQAGRPFTIGYIGRLSEEKGVQNFVRALPLVFCGHKDLRVLIGGDGDLKETIKVTLEKERLSPYINLSGWISREELPWYLNQIQLLVLPSYSEGLPNIVLEAMACGTPVLATPVGAIPDIIEDGKTGFIMENNNPDCIARNIQRVLESTNLNDIAMNAKKIIVRDFTFENTVKQWRHVFNII